LSAQALRLQAQGSREAAARLAATALNGYLLSRGWKCFDAMAAFRPALAFSPVVKVYKSAQCGCCENWAAHLKANGFAMEMLTVSEPGWHRRRLGIPDRLGSCHTGEVAGYGLEGHVPAREIARLLKERPQAAGLAVPGMPPSSPGVETLGVSSPHFVFLIDRRGGESIYASYAK
jgi:hypothetical protein